MNNITANSPSQLTDCLSEYTAILSTPSSKWNEEEKCCIFFIKDIDDETGIEIFCNGLCQQIKLLHS